MVRHAREVLSSLQCRGVQGPGTWTGSAREMTRSNQALPTTQEHRYVWTFVWTNRSVCDTFEMIK